MKTTHIKDDGITIIELEPGNVVLCDLCNDDFTDSDEQGGFLFSSTAVCPHCAPDFLKGVKKCDEEQYIKERCPEDVSFRDWVYTLR